MAPNRSHLLNGEIKSESHLAKVALDWLRNTGSTFQFSWRASGTRIPFYNQQYRILTSRINTLGPNLNPLPSETDFKSLIEKLIQRNRLFKGVEILIIIRISTRLEAIPRSDYLVLTDPYPNEDFQINQHGLLLGLISSGYHPGADVMSYIEQSHPLIQKWIAEARTNNYDTVCLLNQDGMLVETTDACIFLVGQSKVYTPDLKVGCTQRAIRQEILNKIEELGYKGIETSVLEPEHLKQADEVFIANDKNGIRWIMGYENKRYYRKLSQKVLAMINADWANIN
ncbi:MAG: aminotransferase class IV [Bacteroidales bacterium]|nr:aminotransferase class IV [Bacteroidales bacterium]